ncbi:MAG: TauD/TfdA family dioxygenase, partial [Alphaproteobacteria bacterium]|nr:TauD/TfdA family dioxygenase [Alphaproteobacteria bacterium]
ETVARLDASGRDIVSLVKADAPLPTLAGPLEELKQDVLHGIGFGLIRGVPVERYTPRQAAIAFWALGAHLGEAVSQNAKGHALGHVYDLGFDYHQPSARGYQTAQRLPYHCDPPDVVGLLSLRAAKSGGLSSLVSSVSLYNAIADARPDIAELLMQPTYRDRRDEVPEGRKPWYPMPVFNVHRGRLLASYVRSVMHKAQRFPEVPRMTPELEAALDHLDDLAGSPDFCLEMAFAPGDVQFLCNYTILHSRTQYEDWEDPAQKRHLLRLWLACPGGPEIPAYYEEFQGLTASGRPAGILCPGVALNAPLDVSDGGAGDSRKRMAPASA